MVIDAYKDHHNQSEREERRFVISNEDYLELRYGRWFTSDLAEDMNDGDCRKYLDEYWEYISEFND